MSAHEELIEKVTDLINGYEFTGVGSDIVAREVAAIVLAEVLRRLEMVTPEMEASAENADVLQWSLEPGEGLDGTDWQAAWTAMLRASPLNSTPQSNCS